MKYKCIKDFWGLGLLAVGKIYEPHTEKNKGNTFYHFTNDVGRVIVFSDENINDYFEKVED